MPTQPVTQSDSIEDTDQDREHDTTVLTCSACEGPFRQSEDGSGVECMCNDPDAPPSERFACHRCGGPVGINKDLDRNPMDCECPPGEKPDAYRIMTHEESLDRLQEFL